MQRYTSSDGGLANSQQWWFTALRNPAVLQVLWRDWNVGWFISCSWHPTWRPWDGRWYEMICTHPIRATLFFGELGTPEPDQKKPILKCRWPKNRALIIPIKNADCPWQIVFWIPRGYPLHSNPIYIHMRFTRTNWTDLVVSNLALFALFQSNRTPIHAFFEVGYFRAVAWWGNWKSPIHGEKP